MNLLLLISVVILLLLGGILAAIPRLSSKDVPLGVRVPAERLSEPVIATSIRDYRLGVVGITALALLTSVLVATRFTDASTNTVGALVTTIVVLELAAAMWWWTRARIPILDAQAAGGWMKAAATPDQRPRIDVGPAPERAHLLWFLVPGAVLALCAAILAVEYSQLPDPYPIHWNVRGDVDSFSPKTPLTVFAMLLIGFALLIVMWTLERRIALRPPEGESVWESHQLASRILARSALLIGTMFGFGALVPLDPTTVIFRGVVFGGLTAIGLLLVWLFLETKRPPQRIDSAPEPHADNAHWVGGLIYINRDDPDLFVPKRVGFGLTVNLGHPAGIGLCVIVLILLAIPIVLAVIL